MMTNERVEISKKSDEHYQNLPNYLMEWIGLGLNSPKYVKYFFYGVYLPMLVLIIALIVWDFLLMDNEVDMIHVTAIFESMSTFGQPIIRLVFLMIIHSHLIAEILRMRPTFWHCDSYGARLGDNLRREIDIAWLFIKAFLTLSMLTVTAICVAPLMSNSDQQLPLECWIPPDRHVKMLLYCLEIACLLLELCVVIALDGFFVLMCTEIKLQFRLLNEALGSIRIGGDHGHQEEVDCLKACTRHHILLLDVFEKLNGAYSQFFLGQYLIFLSGACIQIFIVTDKTTTIDQNLRSIVYTTAILLQLSLFFIPASNVSDEAEKIPDSIYAIKWYNSSVDFQKNVLFMLMKSQKPVNMTGAGMFYVNRRVFLQDRSAIIAQNTELQFC